MKTAFVTGATGFTGGHLAKRLLKEGWKVKILIRNESDIEAYRAEGFEIAVGDITDQASFEPSLTDVDVVFHIAAYYRSESNEKLFWDTHVLGTKNLLDASIQKGVKRFIHCSTVGVHGEIKDPPADEKTSFDPSDIYQETKLEGEKLAAKYFKEGKIDGAIFRPVGIYGPGDGRFLKLFKMVRSKYTLFVGKADKFYHLTYIDDLVDGILLLAEKDNALGKIFILAGEEYTTQKELMEKIASIMGKPLRMIYLPKAPVYFITWLFEIICKTFRLKPILYRRRLDFFIKDRAFDISKAKDEIGFQPKVHLDEGLQRTYQYYLEQKWL